MPSFQTQVLMASAKTEFTYKIGHGIRAYRSEALKDPKFLRLYRKMSNSGDGALQGAKRDEFTRVKADMERIYAAGSVCEDMSITNISACPKDQKWTLSPNITSQLAKSRNATVLLHIWKSWRDVTGKKVRPLFLRYLELKNESAISDGKGIKKKNETKYKILSYTVFAEINAPGA